MIKIKTLHNIDTEYSADTIEWCPHPNYHEYFVCGTYQLIGDNSESTSPPCRRKGRIYLYRYNMMKTTTTATTTTIMTTNKMMIMKTNTKDNNKDSCNTNNSSSSSNNRNKNNHNRNNNDISSDSGNNSNCNDGENGDDGELIELCRIETAAILDMKWQNNLQSNIYDDINGCYCPILATANALGQVELFSLYNDNLKHLCIIDLNDNYHNLLTLSIDWSWKPSALTPLPSSSSSSLSSSLPLPSSSSSSLSPTTVKPALLPSSSSSSSASASAFTLLSFDQRIVASDSKGDISLLAFTNDGLLKKITSWSAHSFEAWICIFDKWNPYRIYTGGDDTFMHVFDIRQNTEVTKFTTNKSHLAGVTCLLSHPNKENLLLTGSYDEHLRIFDIRNYHKPLCSLNLNGGIWRLKSNPFYHNIILCACMYHNFSIIKINDSIDTVELIGEYNEHTSICYGADWCHQLKRTLKKCNDHEDDDDGGNDNSNDHDGNGGCNNHDDIDGDGGNGGNSHGDDHNGRGNSGNDDDNGDDRGTQNHDDNEKMKTDKNDDEHFINEMIMATCSFYDHKLCASSITMN